MERNHRWCNKIGCKNQSATTKKGPGISTGPFFILFAIGQDYKTLKFHCQAKNSDALGYSSQTKAKGAGV